ncbi:MAG TPA: tetratricopeptide repeat protein, partial [Thermoanaerobaculia bacterium]|nr:tetratricopeptide repeat protein [Thermoanaerobaculia bacterium]
TVYGRGFRFVGDVILESVAPPEPEPPRPKASGPSVAVLPFADLSPERDQGYFCDGIAEELINTLTRLEELRVVSRNVAFDFRNDEDVRTLGGTLGVDHILRGSVRKAEERLRISVHLVDVNSGHHVWSERYDRTVGDVFMLQEEIAENTARVLLGVLSDRNRKAMKSTPVRLDAYEFYLKGRTYQALHTVAALQSAIGMFEIAIEFDTRYAPAYAGLADVLADLYTETHERDLLRRADAASLRAVELAPDLAEAHVCRGSALAAAEKYDDASIEFELALSINPRSLDAHLRYAAVLLAEGNRDEARKMLAAAAEMQPQDRRASERLAAI